MHYLGKDGALALASNGFRVTAEDYAPIINGRQSIADETNAYY